MPERDIIFDGKNHYAEGQSIENTRTGEIKKVSHYSHHFVVERIGPGTQSDLVRILQVNSDNKIVSEEIRPANEIVIQAGVRKSRS